LFLWRPSNARICKGFGKTKGQLPQAVTFFSLDLTFTGSPEAKRKVILPQAVTFFSLDLTYTGSPEAKRKVSLDLMYRFSNTLFVPGQYHGFTGKLDMHF
jgi:hypothetical protein